MIRPFVAWRFRRGFSAGLLWMPGREVSPDPNGGLAVGPSCLNYAPDRRWQ